MAYFLILSPLTSRLLAPPSSFQIHPPQQYNNMLYELPVQDGRSSSGPLSSDKAPPLHPHMHRPTHPPLLHRHRILIPRHKLRSSSLVQEVSMHHFFTMVHYRRMYFATPQRMERSSRMLGFCRCWSRLRMSSLG